MNEAHDEIVEEREELMVSPSGGIPILRKAHFLKPSVASTDGPVAELPLKAPSTSEHKTLKVKLFGWKFPQKNFSLWVQKMASLHEPTWRKAGIFDSIMASTYRIQKNPCLIIGLAEKWCIETKSFVFPWGEATITLEDVMILLGYSVLGSPVFASLEIEEMEEIKKKLDRGRLELVKTAARKAGHCPWMTKFMNSGDEIEHEAFLALWLSRFVFPFSRDLIVKDVLPIAVRLARGSRIALAPAVLASIYRDLSLLKNKIASSEIVETSDQDSGLSRIILRSPFQLVQVWAWERFQELRPKPNPIKKGEPRLSQWHEVKRRAERVSLVLDSAKESFDWHPYTKPVNNWNLPKFYAEKEKWLSIDHVSDDESESFARCLRASELVGLDCVEQYLPNRVALQFGFDQDLPGRVARSNATPETAWNIYSGPICNVKLCIPSFHYKPCITKRYLEWWKKSVETTEIARKSTVGVELKIFCSKLKPSKSKQTEKGGTSDLTIPLKRLKAKAGVQKRQAKSKVAASILKRSTKKLTQNWKGKNMLDFFQVSPCCPQKSWAKSVTCPKGKDACKHAPRDHAEKHSEKSDVSSGVKEKSIEPKSSLKANYEAKGVSGSGSSKKELPISLVIQKELDNSPFPPGFSSRCGGLKVRKSFEDDQMTIAEIRSSDRKHGKNNITDVGKQRCSSNSTGDDDLMIVEILNSNKTYDSYENRVAKAGDDKNSLAKKAMQKEVAKKQSKIIGQDATDGKIAIPVEELVCQKRKHVENENSLDQREDEVSYDSMGEKDPTIAEIQRSSKKRDEVVYRNDKNPGQFEILSSPAADVDKLTVLQTRTEKVKNMVEEPVCIDAIDGIEICDIYSIEVPGLELEARIYKLQKLLAEVKAAMFGQGS